MTYGPNMMSDIKVHTWVRAFKDVWENVHDVPCVVRLSLIREDLVNPCTKKIHEDW